MPSSYIVYSEILIVTAFVLALAYAIRMMKRGRARYERLDRQGGSFLLSKRVMEMGYWAIQPVMHLMVYLGISADALSWGALILGLGAGVSLALGHFGIASIIATVAALLDSLDGLVARATQTEGEAGKLLDSALDRYVEFFFIGGLVIFYRDNTAVHLLALFALFGSFMVSYSTALAEILKVEIPHGGMRRPERMVYLILGTTLTPLTLALYNSHLPMIIALGLVSVIGNISAMRRILVAIRRLKEKQIAKLTLQPAATVVQHLNKAPNKEVNKVLPLPSKVATRL